MAVKPIPEGYHAVTPYMVVDDAAALMDFVRDAFGAIEVERMQGPAGKVQHGEMRIGDSIVMMGQARDEWKARPATMYLYVEDVDAVYQRALQAGARSLQEVKDQFYGDRSGGVVDPGGNYWFIATRKEDVSREELQRRFEAMWPREQ
ncbi:MAG TPA: VOC family protein [Bryobacteraceae bacterium]|jgi:uncharacterized glyoxalase superfamily protein PhnB|nr:VOC family protein [Bryobacteraceae bacterium]